MNELDWKTGKTEWEALEYLHSCVVSLNAQISSLRHALEQKNASEQTTGPYVAIYTTNTTPKTP